MRLLIMVLALAAMPAPTLAWGPTGHRVTAALAEPLLSRKAEREVRAILKTESLAEASTWPDEMRSDPDPFWQETANPWHYVTVPTGTTYRDVGAPPEGDAYTALVAFRAVLKDPAASQADKVRALRFAVHIIADLHQPLHVGSGTDRGGNDVRVTLFGVSTNLHAVWDSGMINRRELSYTEYAAFLRRHISASFIRAHSQSDPLVWIAESAALREGLYPKDPALSWDYLYQHRQTLDMRLMQAGVRIAAYLNNVWR